MIEHARAYDAASDNCDANVAYLFVFGCEVSPSLSGLHWLPMILHARSLLQSLSARNRVISIKSIFSSHHKFQL